jgi:hypothetical protein
MTMGKTVPVRLGGADGDIIGEAAITEEGGFLVACFEVPASLAPLVAPDGGPWSISFQNEPILRSGS